MFPKLVFTFILSRCMGRVPHPTLSNNMCGRLHMLFCNLYLCPKRVPHAPNLPDDDLFQFTCDKGVSQSSLHPKRVLHLIFLTCWSTPTMGCFTCLVKGFHKLYRVLRRYWEGATLTLSYLMKCDTFFSPIKSFRNFFPLSFRVPRPIILTQQSAAPPNLCQGVLPHLLLLDSIT